VPKVRDELPPPEMGGMRVRYGASGEEVGQRHIEDLKTVVANQGHLVVRVAPAGNAYHVIVLTDADESVRARSSVHGPYASR
jgi:hypothetical protein